MGPKGLGFGVRHSQEILRAADVVVVGEASFLEADDSVIGQETGEQRARRII